MCGRRPRASWLGARRLWRRRRSVARFVGGLGLAAQGPGECGGKSGVDLGEEIGGGRVVGSADRCRSATQQMASAAAMAAWMALVATTSGLMAMVAASRNASASASRARASAGVAGRVRPVGPWFTPRPAVAAAGWCEGDTVGPQPCDEGVPALDEEGERRAGVLDQLGRVTCPGPDLGSQSGAGRFPALVGAVLGHEKDVDVGAGVAVAPGCRPEQPPAGKIGPSGQLVRQSLYQPAPKSDECEYRRGGQVVAIESTIRARPAGVTLTIPAPASSLTTCSAPWGDTLAWRANARTVTGTAKLRQGRQHGPPHPRQHICIGPTYVHPSILADVCPVERTLSRGAMARRPWPEMY